MSAIDGRSIAIGSSVGISTSTFPSFFNSAFKLSSEAGSVGGGSVVAKVLSTISLNCA